MLDTENIEDCFNRLLSINMDQLVSGNNYTYTLSSYDPSEINNIRIFPSASDTFLAQDNSRNLNFRIEYLGVRLFYVLVFNIIDNNTNISENSFVVFKCNPYPTPTPTATNTPTPVNVTLLSEGQTEFVSESGTTIVLSNYFVEDTVVEPIVYYGETGETIVVPEGYDYAVFIRSDGSTSSRPAEPGDILVFESDIVLGHGITPTPTLTASNTPTNSVSASTTPTASITASNTPSYSISMSNTPTNSSSITPTPSITASVSNTAEPTPTPTKTPTQSITASNTPSNTITLSNTPTNSPSVSESTTQTPTIQPTATPSNSPTLTPTTTISNTPLLWQ